MIQTNAKALVADVKKAANAMIRLLSLENQYLEKKKIQEVERLTKEKEVLAKHIDTLLSQARAWAKEASQTQRQALQMEMADVDGYLAKMNEVAQRNTVLLEANHTATRTFLGVLRKAVAKPKVEVYGKNGQVAYQEDQPSLMTKSV